jgi:hypothetical protein
LFRVFLCRPARHDDEDEDEVDYPRVCARSSRRVVGDVTARRKVTPLQHSLESETIPHTTTPARPSARLRALKTRVRVASDPDDG